jgi:hypothetical protein
VNKYVRVYYSIVDDERFAGIYDGPHLATWLRLLLIADAIWPATAYLPATEKKASVAALEAAGLVELSGDGRFRIHGLDAERNARAMQGRNAAAMRWQSTSIANPMPSRAEHSQAEPSRAERADAEDNRPDVEAFLEVRRRLPTGPQRKLMDDYCHTFDATGPARATRLILSHPDDPIGALIADWDEFKEKRKADAIAQEVPKPAPRRGSGLSAETQRIARLVAEMDAERAAEAAS